MKHTTHFNKEIRADKGADKGRIPLLEWMRLRAKIAEQMALEAGRNRAVNAKGFLSASKHLAIYNK